jgi:hypothetical protein
LLHSTGGVFDALGTALGGMVVRVEGIDAQGAAARRAWHIAADDNHGPEIPCMAAILLARRLARGDAASCRRTRLRRSAHAAGIRARVRALGHGDRCDRRDVTRPMTRPADDDRLLRLSLVAVWLFTAFASIVELNGQSREVLARGRHRIAAVAGAGADPRRCGGSISPSAWRSGGGPAAPAISRPSA